MPIPTRNARPARPALALALLALACDAPAASGEDGGTVPPLDAGQSDPELDAFDWLADPYVPARRLPGRARLASSRFPEAPDGFDNHDWDNFVRVDGGEAVIFEEQGPGVVTRLWFTMRLDGIDQSPGDVARLHVYVDGVEVPLVDGERGVTLAELTSGRLPAFPRPWAAGRDLSSDALASFVPLHFEESMRLTLDHVPERITYYQIDWRQLPSNARVRSFDGAHSPAQQAALAEATALWVDRAERGSELVAEDVTLAPGESRTIEVPEPGVLRRVALGGDASSLEATLAIDGETVATGPAAIWMFSVPPSGAFESALATGGPDARSVEYPAPIRAHATLEVRNAGSASADVRLELAYDPGSPPADLGALAISCGASTVPTTGMNVALSPIEGARGHYAGQRLVQRGREWGWTMMEGDHEVRADGAYVVLGTGIEDYFGGAFYYLAGPFALPFAGATGFDLMGREHLRAGAVDVTEYRHHLIDTIDFEESFAFEYEVTAPNTTYEHCIYWYRDP